jgi:hypothetical protein
VTYDCSVLYRALSYTRVYDYGTRYNCSKYAYASRKVQTYNTNTRTGICDLGHPENRVVEDVEDIIMEQCNQMTEILELEKSSKNNASHLDGR